MLSAAEIARGSQGAIKFLLRDSSAPLHFDNTPAACLRSFQVMILAAPVYALYLGHALHADLGRRRRDRDRLGRGAAFRGRLAALPVIFYEIAGGAAGSIAIARYIAPQLDEPADLLTVLLFETFAWLADRRPSSRCWASRCRAPSSTG
jgi:hypothetical protein